MGVQTLRGIGGCTHWKRGADSKGYRGLYPLGVGVQTLRGIGGCTYYRVELLTLGGDYAVVKH